MQKQQKKQKLTIKALKKDREVEVNFLAVALMVGDTFGVAVDAFIDPELRRYFEAAVELESLGEEVNIASVYSHMNRTGKDPDPVFLAWLFEHIHPFLPGKVNMEHAHYFVRDFIEYYQARLYAKTLLEQLSDVEKGEIAGQISQLQQKLEELRDLAKAKEASSAKQIALGVYELLEAGEMTGPSTGFPALNKRIGGWMPSTINIIAGRPSMGKTSLMLSSLLTTAKRIKHMVVSLEMSKEQLMIRLVCAKTGLSYLDVCRIDKKPELWPQVSEALAELGKLNFSIVDGSRMPLLELEQLVRAEKPNVVWVDYLQMLNNALPGSFQNRDRELAAYSSFLKGMAKKFNIPVNVLSQLNRSNVKEGRPPTMADLRESGAIEQDADTIIAVHANPGKEEEERVLLVLKGRNMAKGQIKMGWDGPKMLFFERSFYEDEDVPY